MKKQILTLLTLFYCLSGFAATFNVNSVATFNEAQNAASPGDIIIWRSGTYSNRSITITKSNLTIRAEVPGGTIFNGSSRVRINGNNNTFSGFQYIGGRIPNTQDIIEIRGDNNTLSQLNLKDYYSRRYLTVHGSANGNTITYSNFENRTYIADQNILQIHVSSSSPSRTTIRFCSFQNIRGPGNGRDFGVEPIRIGAMSEQNNIGRCLVEFCYFNNCDGDGEIISHKSRENVYRYNTFDGNRYAELVLRHGDRGIVYGNFFINGMGGVRVEEGENHAIYNNYFGNLSGGAIKMTNDNDQPVKRVLIAHNTIVESGAIVLNRIASHGTTRNSFCYSERQNF